MRLKPTSRSFLLGLAIGAASILALGFLDMWIHDEIPKNERGRIEEEGRLASGTQLPRDDGARTSPQSGPVGRGAGHGQLRRTSLIRPPAPNLPGRMSSDAGLEMEPHLERCGYARRMA
jgi:hypothetical protein